MSEFKIKRNARDVGKHVSTLKPRVSWPWKHMNIGDEVTIPETHPIEVARVAAHVYGRNSGKRFNTETKQGKLVVWRVE